MSCAMLCNINSPTSDGRYGQKGTDQLIASTIDDDPSKSTWSHNTGWEDGPYGGPALWPTW